jgi:hypothetical protein
MFTTVRNWRKRRNPRPDLRILMYTRAGCHLCDDAWDFLMERQRLHGFHLESVDVDTQPELVARYGDCVPVVLVNEQVRFRGQINEVLFDRILDANSDH